MTDKLGTAKGQKFRVGTTQIVVDDVLEMPTKQFQIKLSITEENVTDHTWVNSLWYRLEVQDEKGNKILESGK